MRYLADGTFVNNTNIREHFGPAIELTNEQVLEKNLELLQVYHFDKKIRCGINSDGGYVIAELDGGYDCYISAGIFNEESFSRDFINKYNINKNN